MKKNICVLLCAMCVVFLIGCSHESANATNGVGGSELPSDLTNADLEIVQQINSQSNLFCSLYEEVEVEDESDHYEILAGERSCAYAVRIPKEDGALRVKEIEIIDSEFDVFGLAVGTTKSDFEAKMAEKGFEQDMLVESMGLEYFKAGNVFIGINYDKNHVINRMSLNLAVDYDEWRGIE